VKSRKRWLQCLLGAILVVAVILFFCLSSVEDSAPVPVKWKPHPDFFPMGTVLQGSTVEMSLRFTSDDMRPPPPPPWVKRLPRTIRPWAIGLVDRFRAGAARKRLQITVDAPEYLRVDAAEIDYHQFHGSTPSVKLHLITDRPGSYNGSLTIRLTGSHFTANTNVIPIRVNVIAKPERWAVLATRTPFEKYSTDDGRMFEPLTDITSRLAERGVRVDFREHLSKSLDAWNVILLGEGALLEIDAKAIDRLQGFVARGGRLIVSADAFMVGTAPKANDLVNRYGLRIDNKDAGHSMEASRIVPDPLTTGVTGLSFYRPTCVSVTDSKQAKLLGAMTDDEQCGFIAVSRASGRGEVVLLAQSLWWVWVQPHSGRGENARMVENLFEPTP
jgi:hypothetical protein